MNMFCLITAGPVVERFFGHLGFALLYILSGVGGAITSLWVGL
jgi:rhomboid protease GluP